MPASSHALRSAAVNVPQLRQMAPAAGLWIEIDSTPAASMTMLLNVHEELRWELSMLNAECQ